MGKQPGCGFTIAPEWLVTCAHVVGRHTAEGSSIELQPWQGPTRNARLHALEASRDLALLHDPQTIQAPTIPLGNDLQLDNPLAGIGFPVYAGKAEFDQFTARYEGITDTRDVVTNTSIRLLKLKGGQIDYGFSGGPLLNLRSGHIVGVTRLSRDTRSDMGGWAIPIGEVEALCAAVGIALPGYDHDVQPPNAVLDSKILARLRNLLVALPRWNDRRRRRAFVNSVLWGHPVLQEIELDGTGVEVAADLVAGCLERDEPTATGQAPLCALLLAIAQEYGPKPTRDQEIAALSAALNCHTD
jgi:hypothetical protein